MNVVSETRVRYLDTCIEEINCSVHRFRFATIETGVEWKQKPESTSGRHRCLNSRCRYEDLDGACRTPLLLDIVASDATRHTIK